MAKSWYKEWLKNDELEGVLLKIARWKRNGAKDKEIATALKIGESTLKAYKVRYKDFKAAFKKGREICDAEIENALISNAKGGYYYEEQAFKCKDIDPETGKGIEVIKIVEVKKYQRPDTTAIMYYLNNRLPKDWNKAVFGDGTDDAGIEDIGAMLEAVGIK